MNTKTDLKNEHDANLELVNTAKEAHEELNETLLAIARAGVTVEELEDPWGEWR